LLRCEDALRQDYRINKIIRIAEPILLIVQIL